MDLTLSEDQKLLRDSVERMLAGTYDFDARRGWLEAEGWSRENWGRLAELGLLAAPLPEAHGGLGGGAVEVMLITEAFGGAMVLEPYIPCVILGAGLVSAAGDDAQKAAILPAVASGELILAAGLYEASGRYRLAPVETRARRDGAGWILDGRKGVVVGAPQADTLLISARTGGAAAEASGVSLFLVPASSPGLTVTSYALQDGRRAGEVRLDGVRLGAEQLVGPEGGALPFIEVAVDHAIAATCAEAVGAMRAIHQSTLAYARERKQFGESLASFQVLQHRMVDMYIAVEQAVSASYLATLRLGGRERARACAAAKVQVGKSARLVGQGAVQIHGGMGVTNELKAAHLFKRLIMFDAEFGDTEHHLRRFAALAA